MNNIATNKDEISSNWLIQLIWNFKWVITGFVAIVMILVWIATQFMPPLYESTVTLYATNPKANANVLEYQEFGWDVDSDRHIQILKSKRVRDSVIQKFNLIQHYNIDTSQEKWKNRLHNKYKSRVNLERTAFMSIKINVKDKSPEMASRIANEIARLGDVVKADILKNNVRRALNSIEKQYKEKQQEVDKLTKELIKMKEISANKAVAKLERKIRKKSAKVEQIRKELNDIRSQHQVHNLRAQIDEMREHLTDAQSKYLFESGKLALYEERLPKSDTTRIKTEARVKGALKKKEQLQKELGNMTEHNLRFNQLKNSISLHLELLNDFKRRIQNITAAYQPSAQHVRLERKRQAFNSELERLNDLKTKYEKALQQYEKPIPQSYIISRAEPNYQPVAPNVLFILLIAGVLSTLFITGLLAFIQRLREFG